jgi:hypothetical protein
VRKDRVVNFFKKNCAKPKSSAILTGSADKKCQGLTRGKVGGGGGKDFLNFFEMTKNPMYTARLR